MYGYFCSRGHITRVPDYVEPEDITGKTLPCSVCGAQVVVGDAAGDEVEAMLHDDGTVSIGDDLGEVRADEMTHLGDTR